MRKVPILPTILVLAVVAVLIRFGLWQVERLHEKQAMLAQYETARRNAAVTVWPNAQGQRPHSYGHIRTTCQAVKGLAPQAGRNAQDQAGWAQVANCVLPAGLVARVVLGWASAPAPVAWSGGEVAGTFLDKGKGEPIIVADPPLAGLAPNARPDPSDIPNNHLSYAVQWFSFAAIALVIYTLALRKRWRG